VLNADRKAAEFKASDVKSSDPKSVERKAGDARAMDRKTIVFFLVPDFTMLPFTASVEPLRAANRMLGFEAYSWRLCSIDGKPVRASNGIEVAVNTSVDDERRLLSGNNRPNMVFVCSGLNVEAYRNKHAFGFLREEYNKGVAVGGMCTGAHILAEAGLLAGKRIAIHWENIPGFTERFPKTEVFADLFEIDGKIHTCAGGTASLDMMLQLIGQDHGDGIVNRICEMVLTDRVRSPKDRQRLPLRARLGIQNPRVIEIIEQMESHISEPVELVAIADAIGLSRRQVERLFRQEMGRSPARYYLEIRLDRARHLLIQSTMPIVEVAIACGFVSASHFSKCYRELYDRSPQQERADRKRVALAA
jgi:transcriptional regulator GlxA family with amidase domain